MGVRGRGTMSRSEVSFTGVRDDLFLVLPLLISLIVGIGSNNLNYILQTDNILYVKSNQRIKVIMEKSLKNMYCDISLLQVLTLSIAFLHGFS